MNSTSKQSEIKTSFLNFIPLGSLIIGIVLFYTIDINPWFKWGQFLFFTIIALASFFWLAPMGINLHGYFRDSWREWQKVVWPTRKESTQFTWIVFVFVVLLGLFLWAVDSTLSWLFYNIILGRGH